jgi:hypothetical protein
VHKRPADSLRRHSASLPVSPRPARPSVGRREVGGKSWLPSDQIVPRLLPPRVRLPYGRPDPTGGNKSIRPPGRRSVQEPRHTPAARHRVGAHRPDHRMGRRLQGCDALFQMPGRRRRNGDHCHCRGSMIDSPPVQDRQWSRSNTPDSQVFDPGAGERAAVGDHFRRRADAVRPRKLTVYDVLTP